MRNKSHLEKPITGAHTQNTDTKLDEGGANEIDVTEIPKMATANVTYYVATDGDDSKPGTDAEPFATIQHAIDSIPKILNGYGADIYLKDGTYAEGNIEIHNFVSGDISLWSANWDADLVVIEVPANMYVGFSVDHNSAFIYLAAISIKIQRNNSNCIEAINSSHVQIEDAKVGDNNNTGTTGIYSIGSIIDLRSITDIDANKVATGCAVTWGGILSFYNTNSFGDTFTDVSNGGIISDGIRLVKADYDDAITKKHTPNTDTKLDDGEANEVTAAGLRAHLDNLDISGYQHLLAAEYTELSEWLDDVTLGSDGLTSVPEMVLTPRASALSDVVGGIYFSSIDKSVYCCTEI
ncbi:hypothetical protein KAX97_09615 [candidate division WOR-3 bacterium]|nr:hypothetical protein [candidate division WOR-3 bacterium]